MSRWSRLVPLLAVVLLTPVLVTVSGGQATGEPGPAPRAAEDQWPGDGFDNGPVDADHPYSAPVFYPLRQYMRMDCYRSNPGCPTRPDWTLTLSVTAPTGPGDNAVFAMGAGIVRAVRQGVACDPEAEKATFGTTIEISHGGGVVTRYGHLDDVDLAKYQALVGQLVAAGDRIGTMGLTGSRDCDGDPYLNFQVERNGRLVEMKTLEACLDGRSEQWPRDQFPGYPTWNQMREDNGLANRDPAVPFENRSFFPRMKEGERPGILEAANAPDQSCVPTTAPDTPNRPAAPRVARAGSGRVLVSWRGMPARTAALVRVQRQGRNGWVSVGTAAPRAGGHSVHVGDLQNRVKHRFLLSYRRVGSSDWSATSPGTERVVGDVPTAPAYRFARVSGRGTALRLSWRMSRQRGFVVSGYEVAIRLRTSTRWSSRTLRPGSVSHLFQDLRPSTRYTVRVRALSAAGPSAWTARNVTTTP